MSNQFFKTKLCRSHRKGKCKLGDRCGWAHSLDELRPVTDLSKTSLCKAHIEAGGCKDRNCKYAHGAQELRSTQDYWKTSLCIFWIEGTCRLGSKCRHAHGLEELHCRAYRRGDMGKRDEIQRREMDKIQRFLQRCAEKSGGGVDVARMLHKATEIIPQSSGEDRYMYIDSNVFPQQLNEPLRLLTSEQRANFARMNTPQRCAVLHMLRDVANGNKAPSSGMLSPRSIPMMSPMVSPVISPKASSSMSLRRQEIASPRAVSPLLDSGNTIWKPMDNMGVEEMWQSQGSYVQDPFGRNVALGSSCPSAPTVAYEGGYKSSECSIVMTVDRPPTPPGFDSYKSNQQTTSANCKTPVKKQVEVNREANRLSIELLRQFNLRNSKPNHQHPKYQQ